MDPGRLLATVQRVSASLAASWAAAVLHDSAQFTPTWQLAPALIVATAAVFALAEWVSPDMSALVQRLTLTVVAQQLFTLTPTSTDASLPASINAAAYASMVLLALGSLRILGREESEIFIGSATFMFAAVMHALFARFRDHIGSRELAVAVLVVARTAIHGPVLHSPGRLLADGISVMIYNELAAVLVPHTWPLGASLAITLVLSRLPVQLNVPQIVQYSAWQTATELNVAVAGLAEGRPLAGGVATFVLFQLTMALESNALTGVLRDVVTLAFFNVLLDGLLRLLDSLLPGDHLFALCMSLTLFVACKQCLTPSPKK